MGAIVALSSGIVIAVLAEEKTVPSWIKNTAKFWINDQITDKEFLQTLQYLIDKKILIIPKTSEPQEKQTGQTSIDPQLYAEITRTVRDCLRYAEEYNQIQKDIEELKIGATPESQIAIADKRELIAMCDSQIKEIDQNCSLYNLCQSGAFGQYFTIRAQYPEHIYPETMITLQNLECERINDGYYESKVTVVNNYKIPLSPAIELTSNRATYNSLVTFDYVIVKVDNLQPNEKRQISTKLVGSAPDIFCRAELLSFK